MKELKKAQEIAELLIEECSRIRPGDIGGKLLARSIAEFVIDQAAKKREAKLVNDSFEG